MNHQPCANTQTADTRWRDHYSHKAPFPWFGGKSKAASLVWSLLGDPAHYIEPFCGTCAVLLNRPHVCNRPYFSETVGDKDGLLVNAWRAIQFSPDAVAEVASWPVSEADKIARQLACLQWIDHQKLEHLMCDWQYHDTMIAGFWLYGVACQIGGFTGDGPWTADPTTGRIHKQAPGPARQPGVSRDLPFLGNAGRGVNNPSFREPGVSSEPYTEPLDYHPMTMPKLREWFRLLAARLRHVRIVNGDWRRIVTHGATHTLGVGKRGPAGVFLDPPYSSEVRTSGLYRGDNDAPDIAADVRAWCLKHGTDPDLRIVLAGFDSEHGDLEHAGWSCHEWFTHGFLTGGMGNTAGSGQHQQARERLWASPGCLAPGPSLEGTDD